MLSKASTVDEYLASLSPDRRHVLAKIREVLIRNLPPGFQEEMSYGMIGYVVPLSVYPKGYHTKRGQPLPFMNLASQKNYIALYHMGITADAALLSWFEKRYREDLSVKPDIGKSCIRLKEDKIPYSLIGELAARMTPQDWIRLYENGRANS